MTSKYGEISRIHPHGHYGLDLACPSGTPLHSPVDGIVIKIVDQGSTRLGKGIFIKTDDGYQFIFGHLSKFIKHVGDVVHRGDVVGLSGNTGHSTAPHLHLAIKNPSGRFIDPESYPIVKHTMASISHIGDKFMDLLDVITELV
ncbi:MAG: M23 family metallopeptidase [Neobacillus sp.]